MLKKIALAVILIQVSAFSALATQTLLFASSTTTQAAAVQPVDAVRESECQVAMWPNIPQDCLKQVATRTATTSFTIIAQ